VARLETLFHGLVSLAGLPSALFVVDSKKEHTAIAEAKRKNVPVIALASSDCDLGVIDYPIPGNDASRESIKFFVEKIAAADESGRAGKTESK
jgi:small subunit ribosomal protein S2